MLLPVSAQLVLEPLQLLALERRRPVLESLQLVPQPRWPVLGLALEPLQPR